MKRHHGLPLAAITIACALTACGGGQQEASQASSGLSSMAAAATMASKSAADTLLRITPDAADPNLITVRLFDGSAWQPVQLVGQDGVTPIRSIDALPQGLASFIAQKRWDQKGHLRVKLDAGTYRMRQGWQWPSTASGTSITSQVVLEPFSATGGVIISGAQSAQATNINGLASVQLPAGLTPSLLWAENRRAVLARSPNVGQFYYVNDIVPGKLDTGVHCDASATDCVVSTVHNDVPLYMDGPISQDVPLSRQAFQADARSLNDLDAARLDPRSTVVLMHSWTTSRLRPVSVNKADQEAQLALNTDAGAFPNAYFMASGPVQRYFVENLASALDAAGEWYAGTDGVLKYIPTSTANNAKVSFEIPQVTRLLVTQGNAAANAWVQWVQFNGLKFRHAAYAEMLPDGTMRAATTQYVDAQAAFRVSAAIELNDTRNVEFHNDEISQVGGYGIWFNRHAQGNTVNNADIYDTGAGGVKIGQADFIYLSGATKQLYPSLASYEEQLADGQRTGGNTVSASRIYGTGHTFPGAAGIWLGRSNGNTVTKNLIKDTTYSGISVGWDWSSMQTALAANNTISSNMLLNIGQGTLSDLAGIYTLGNQGNASTRTLGTRITGNVIKNVMAFDGYGPLGAGIYHDQGSAWILDSGNLVDTVNGVGYTVNVGQYSQDVNNIKSVNNAFANVAYLAPAPILDYPAVAASPRPPSTLPTFPNSTAMFSSNVVVPTLGLLQVDDNSPMPNSRSLATSGNLISNQLDKALSTENACQVAGKAWCAVKAVDYLAAPVTSDIYSIQQFKSSVSNTVFPRPKAPNLSTTTWAAEGAKLKSNTVNAAPFWAESDPTARPSLETRFDASRWPVGKWIPSQTHWQMGDSKPVVEVVKTAQSGDGVRAVKLKTGDWVSAYQRIQPEANASKAVVIKAALWVDDQSAMYMVVQSRSGDANGPLVKLQALGNGQARLVNNFDAPIVLTNASGQAVSLKSGTWYEITMTATLHPTTTNPGGVNTTVEVRALNPDPSTGSVSIGALLGSSSFAFPTSWNALGLLAMACERAPTGTSGFCRLGRLKITQQ